MAIASRAIVALVAAFPLQAQVEADREVSIEVRLAADPDRDGPPALVWLRGELLSALPALDGFDPFAAITLGFDAEGARVLETATVPAPGSDYATWRADVEGIGAITGRCTVDGLAEVHLDRSKKVPLPLRRLVELTGLGRHDGPIVLDTATAVGLLHPAAEGDPLAAALTLAATECGEITIAVRERGEQIRLVARSRGGLLLPAALTAMAAAADDGAPGPGSTDRWLWLAHCARDDERDEAARQLAVSKDPAARVALQNLLHSPESMTRAVAMAGLIRSGAADALPELVAAADPEVPLSEPLAEAALWTLLPDAGEADRAGVLRSLREHPSGRMRALADQLTATPPAAPVVTPDTSEAPTAPRLPWPAALVGSLTLSSVLIGATILMGLLHRPAGARDEFAHPG